MRKRRPGEEVCRCGAYRFPHRMMGGKCDGGAFIEAVFELRRDCRDCHFLDGHECEVLQGRETNMRCPALEEHVRYHGIKLYGVNNDR